MADRIEFYEHPEFASRKHSLRTYRDLYEGDHATLTNPAYLWPHELEGSLQPAGTDSTGHPITVGQKLRNIRALRSRYLNLFEPIVSNWISLLFHKPVKLGEATLTMLGDDIHDIDGQGTSLENFIKGPLATAYFRDGQPLVLVDAPENTARNRKEEQELGHRPYVELLDTLSVMDWQIIGHGPFKGRFQWLRWEYEEIEPRESPTDAPQCVTYCKVLQLLPGMGYIVTVYRKDDNDWKLFTRSGVPDWEELPVSTIHTNAPWVKDLVDPQLSIFNDMSAWSNQRNTQAFQRIMVAGDMGEKHQIAISEYAISFLPTGAVPHVISPASTEANEKAVGWNIDQMYRIAFNRSRALPSDSKEAPGEDTLREMNQELVTVLMTAASELESVVKDILRHVARFKGKKDFEPEVTISADLTAADVGRQIETFLAYKDEIKKVLPWRKAHLKKVALQGNYSDEELEEITAGIDQLKDEPLVPPMALALGKKPPLDNGEETEQDAEATGKDGEAPDNGDGSENRRPRTAARKVPAA